jgi:hypothetical protein
MTPKEKAENLFNIIDECCDEFYGDKRVKKCALIAVDEVINAVNNPDEIYLMKHSVEYWSEVKQEIEKL